MISIEINGTGTHNRGAQLMAIAISDVIRSRYPDARIIVAPGFGKWKDRQKYGFFTTWAYEGGRKTIPWCLCRFLPKFITERLKIVDPKSIDVVLDASGFAFSDQWGPGIAQKLVDKMSSPGRLRQKLILLPQALGTFEKKPVADICRILFERASLVCARDPKSHEVLVKLGPKTKIVKYPDFTVSVPPVKFEGVSLPSSFVAIVPNLRMLDKGSPEDYISFLNTCLEDLQKSGKTPVFVLHDAQEDAKVLSVVAPQFQNVPVIKNEDPQILKYILGKADFVIGSRFHALVSSLSQGVPCIGAGWSHKYPELFGDFAAGDLLIQDLKDKDSIYRVIGRLSITQERDKASGAISEAAAKIKKDIVKLWDEVFEEVFK